MTYELLNIEINEKIALIELNRPKALNALNQQLIKELSQLLNELKGDKNVRVLLLKGSGEKAFVAGADIKEFSHFDSSQGAELAAKGQENLFNKIENFPKPVIALVNGFALGGGLELALACHFRLASDNAKMGLPEVSLGLIPGYGGTQRLPLLIGKGRAMQMILSGEMIGAEKAKSIGLVNDVFEQNALVDEGKKIAGKIFKQSSSAQEKAIHAVNNFTNDKGYSIEIESFGGLFDTEDFKEGVDAFLNKRKPNFN